MSNSVVWWVVLAVVAIGAAAWFFLRRSQGDDAPAAPTPDVEPAATLPPVTAPVDLAPVAPPLPAPAPAPPPIVPPPAPAPPPRAAPAPVPAPPPLEPRREAPPVVVAPPWVAPPVAPRPPAVVVERVLMLEASDASEWDVALPLALLPAQSAAVDAALAGRKASSTIHCIDFAAGTATAIARGDLVTMRSLAAAKGGGARKAAVWLDSSAATALVATALAALAAERFLTGLGDEVRELKAAFAALPPRLAAQGGNTVKTLVQDLSRFAREARDNYASAIGKLAFRERVGEAEERAVEIWRDAVARTDAVRQQMDALASLSRFGEVQVEKALALCRELQEQRRLQEIAARVLAGAHLLRVSIGDVPAGAAADPLASALAALQAGLEKDAEIASRLAASERGAKGDAYVGKAEFEANRASLRKLLDKAADATMQTATQRLETARAATPLDAAGGMPKRLLIGPVAGDVPYGLRWLAKT